MKKILTLAVVTLLGLAHALAQTNTIQLRNGANTTTILPSASSTIAVQIPALSAGTHYLLTSTSNPGSGGVSINSLSDGKLEGESSNNFLGSMKLGSRTTGVLSSAWYNTAVGMLSMNALSGGSANVSLGYNSLNALTLGNENTAIGANALNALVGANYNTAVGTYAGVAITSGAQNVLLGRATGYALTTGSGNVLIGYNVGFSIASDASNLLYIDNSTTNTPLIYGDFSTDALTFNGTTTTTGNMMVGGGAANSELRILEIASDGSNYTAFKVGTQTSDITYTLPQSDGTNGQALVTNGSGVLSWGSSGATSLDGLSDAKVEGTNFVGSMILGSVPAGTLSDASDNTAVGIGAMSALTEGQRNTAFGGQALGNLTTGLYNTGIGYRAGKFITTQSNNTAIGYRSMYKGIGEENTYVGSETGGPQVDGGSYNVGLGFSAMMRVISGTYNTAIGHRAANELTTGSNNVLIGRSAGYNLRAGSNNVYIGKDVGSDVSLSDGSNLLAIDNSNTLTPLIYGNFSTDQLTLNGHVEVAIGTTTSTVPFSIVGTGIQGAANVENAYLGTDVPTLFVRNSTNSADADALLVAGVGGSSAGDAYISLDVATVGGWSIGLDNSDSDKLKFVDSWNFRSDGGGFGLPVMTMTRSTRRVGIGTENPAYMLDVAGDINASGALTITGAATVGPYLNVLRLDNESGGEIAIEFGDDDGYWIIEDVSPATGDPERLRIYSGPGGEAAGITLTAAGNVGMGKAAPAYKLDVVGDINASANVRAAGTALTSDARLKRNIQPLTNALDVVQQLRPVSYEKRADLRSNDYSMKQMGFIAQELESVLPNSVQTDKSADAIKSVDYISIIPVLTKALQEQQELIVKQQELVAKQQQEIDELKKMVKRMSLR